VVPAPADAVALNGTYVGKASGRPMSLSVHFDDAHQVSMVLRVAERAGAVTSHMSGRYTLAPDGSVDFALSERTLDGVVGYVGTLSVAGVDGIVTLDGRRRGRFFGGR